LHEQAQALEAELAGQADQLARRGDRQDARDELSRERER
jgi:hypothetical protein